MNIQTIKNVADCKPLYLPHSLYLKPLAKVHLSVALPSSITGKTICNWDVMEKLRNLILPDTFAVLRVAKTTIEFIRLEAEVEDRSHLKQIQSRLDGATIKLPGFTENMRIRASEPKDDFASRHDWDSFFRDARNMDEMKAGERPDTVYISNLPIKWFCPRHQINADHPKPSENIFKRIFEKFGEVRCVDIPICDPYRGQMKSNMTGLKSFSVDNETYFEGYVQFNEYLGFVKAMDEFRGMKLVHKEGELSQAINIIVEFDKTKHLSDVSIKRRKVVRERLIEKEREADEEERKKREQLELKKRIEQEKLEAEKRKEAEKQQQREARRKEKQLKKLRDKETMDFQSKIVAEEKKLLQAQRKLESIRLLEALFARIQMKTKATVSATGDRKAEKKAPMDLRDKLVTKYKNAHEGEFKKRMDKVQKAREGKVILTDLLHADGKRSPSIDSISSEDSLFGEDDKKKRKKKKKRSSSSSSSSSGTSSKSNKREENNKDPNSIGGQFPPQPFPPSHPSMYNPEMGDWYGMNMYPYGAGYFPTANVMQPNFYPGNGFNPNYRGNGGFRGRGRGRGRGYYGANRYREFENRHDRRTRSRSRSYSRSRSRSPRRRNRSHQESKKLASTLRSRRTPSSPESHSRRSRRTRSRSWSRRRRSRSSSSSSSSSDNSRYHSRGRKRSSRRSDSRASDGENKKKTSTSPPPDVKEQINDTASTPPPKNDTPRTDNLAQQDDSSASRKRSASVDSAKFRSPKRKERSKTPDWSNKN